MQEKYLLRTKGVIKKIGAVSTTLAMLGSTVAGAFAADLSKDYPSMFSESLAFVVGSNAGVADTLGSIDIMGDVQYSAKECVPTAGTVSVSGGVTEDIPLGFPIADSRSTTLDQELEDDDIETLIDSTITFQSTDYDVKEVLVLDQGTANITVATSLTSAEDDYETGIFLEVERDAIKYYYAFDESIEINKTTSSDPLEIKFLGRTIKVTAVDSDTKFTANVGAEFFMTVDDTVTVNDKKVTLKNVGSGGAIVVTVDGVEETIPSGSTETVNGIEIKNDETFYEDNKAQRSATLVIGEDAVETYKDGDAYVGEDENDPNWVWNVAGLKTTPVSSTTTSSTAEFTGPFFGIENDFVWNDDSDNPAGVGECIDLPDNYISVCFDSITVGDADYKTFTFERDSSSDLSEAIGENTSVKTIFIHTNQDEGINVEVDQLNAQNETSDVKTDKVWLYTENNSDVLVFYEDTNGKTRLAGSIVAGEAQVTEGLNFADINYDNTKGTDVELWLTTVEGIGNANGTNLTLVPFDSTDLPGYVDNITMRWTYDTLGFKSLGATVSSEEAGELVWENTQPGNDSINLGTKDEDHRSSYGIIIRDPKAHGASDEVVLDIPRDQVQANIVVKGSTATTSAGGETCTIKQVTPTNLRDTEVTDVTRFNAVFVGGPCADPLVEDVFGVTCSDWPLQAGEAMVKLVANGNKLAMLVAGTEAIDTQRAAKAIRSKAVSLSGTEVVLTTATDTVTVQS